VKWWAEAPSFETAVVDFEKGLFVDREWMHLAPMLCDGVHVTGSGLNVASDCTDAGREDRRRLCGHERH